MTEASLHAVQRFNQFIAELPTLWRPGSPKWQNMRFWAIDATGDLCKIPAEPLMGWGDRLLKDSLAIIAAVYCLRHKPDALIMGAEAWMCAIEPEKRQLLMAREKRTPDLMDPANRQRLHREYGATIRESLLIFGELRGLPGINKMYQIDNGTLTDMEASHEPYTKLDNRFAGILTGDWKP